MGNGQTTVILAPNTGLDTLVIPDDFSGKLVLDMSAFGIDYGSDGFIDFAEISPNIDLSNSWSSLHNKEGFLVALGDTYADASTALQSGIQAIYAAVDQAQLVRGDYIPDSSELFMFWDSSAGLMVSWVLYHTDVGTQNIVIDQAQDIALFEGRDFASLNENVDIEFPTSLLTGTTADEMLTGSVTDDLIISGGGIDYITGGLGSDTLVVSPTQSPETEAVLIFRPQDLAAGEIDRVVGVGESAGDTLYDMSQFGVDNGIPLFTDIAAVYQDGSTSTLLSQQDPAGADLVLYSSISFTTAPDALASLQTAAGPLSPNFFMAWNMNGVMAVSYISEGAAAGDLFIIDGHTYEESLLGFEAGSIGAHDINLIPFQVGTNTIPEGPELSDHLQGGSTTDILMGMNGRDLLEGGDSNDILFGDRVMMNTAQRIALMNTFITGGYPDLSQLSFSGDGADSLWGGRGSDYLIGGAGADGFGFRPEDLGTGEDWVINFEVGTTYTDGNGNQHYYSDYIDLTDFKVDNGDYGRADVVYLEGSAVDLSSADIVIDTTGLTFLDGVEAIFGNGSGTPYDGLVNYLGVTGADNEFFYVWQDFDLDVRLSYVEDFDHDGILNPDEVSDIAILTNINPSPDVGFDMYTLNQDHFLINDIQTMTNQWDNGGAYRWASTNINYNFAPNITEFEDDGGTPTTLTDGAKQAITDALTLWSESNGLTFNLVGDTESADLSIGIGQNTEGWDFKRFNNSDQNGITDARMWLNEHDFGWVSEAEWAPGASSAFYDLLGGIGNLLGLHEPQRYGDWWEHSPYIHPEADDGSATVFNWNGSANWPTDAWTPMMLDHEAMQFLYGVDTTTRTGTTKYGYGAKTNYTMGDSTSGVDLDYLNFTDNGPIPVGVIWDGGGEDALAWNPADPTPVKIDLRPGHFSSMGGLTDNIGIAEGTTIERAGGGAGDDTSKGMMPITTYSAEKAMTSSWDWVVRIAYGAMVVTTY